MVLMVIDLPMSASLPGLAHQSPRLSSLGPRGILQPVLAGASILLAGWG